MQETRSESRCIIPLKLPLEMNGCAKADWQREGLNTKVVFVYGPPSHSGARHMMVG